MFSFYTSEECDNIVVSLLRVLCALVQVWTRAHIPSRVNAIAYLLVQLCSRVFRCIDVLDNEILIICQIV